MNQEIYRSRLKDIKENPTELALYIQHNCKKCNNTGWIIKQIPPTIKGHPWNELKLLCLCVLKNLEKEIKSV
jgi:hypothetical protein